MANAIRRWRLVVVSGWRKTWSSVCRTATAMKIIPRIAKPMVDFTRGMLQGRLAPMDGACRWAMTSTTRTLIWIILEWSMEVTTLMVTATLTLATVPSSGLAMTRAVTVPMQWALEARISKRSRSRAVRRMVTLCVASRTGKRHARTVWVAWWTILERLTERSRWVTRLGWLKMWF